MAGADNFYNAKRFGFIPSYPDDLNAQGPNPEPWEFVWVGVDLIECGMPCVAAVTGPEARHPGGVTPADFGLDQTPGASIGDGHPLSGEQIERRELVGDGVQRLKGPEPRLSGHRLRPPPTPRCPETRTTLCQ